MAAKKRARRPKAARRTQGDKVRVPKQERARDTVEAILRAARDLLVKGGLEAATTNAIAERAGVSIGSVYQYFEGRDGIVTELSRRHVEEAVTLLFREVDALRDVSLAVGVPRVIRALLAIHRRDPALHRIIESTIPQLGVRAHIPRVNDAVMKMAEAYLAQHRSELVVDDLSRAAFVAVGAIEALTHNALIERPELLADDALVDDLARMLLGYLTGKGMRRSVRAG